MPIPSATPATYRGTFAHGETVEVLSAGTTVDPYSGEPSESWAAEDVTEVVVDGVGVEPRPTSRGDAEPVQDARNAVSSGFTLYLPEMPLTSRERVRVRGVVYNVLGEPSVWRNPFTGWAPGIVVQVDRTEG